MGPGAPAPMSISLFGLYFGPYFADWNRDHPGLAVCLGDRIVNVNGKQGACILGECVQKHELHITFERGLPKLEGSETLLLVLGLRVKAALWRWIGSLSI